MIVCVCVWTMHDGKRYLIVGTVSVCTTKVDFYRHQTFQLTSANLICLFDCLYISISFVFHMTLSTEITLKPILFLLINNFASDNGASLYEQVFNFLVTNLMWIISIWTKGVFRYLFLLCSIYLLFELYTGDIYL